MPRKLALAKLSPPRLHDVLARKRLDGLLDEAAQRPVVWLCAQPGAGKTTLAASWLQSRKRPLLWYQVDAGDADAASFVYHLSLAAEAHAPASRGKREALPLLTPEYLQDLAGFARRYFRALYARLEPDCALVLDNFQEAPPDAAFHRLVAEAAAQLPGEMHLVVISRSEPGPRYAPLLADDSIAIVDGSVLRLTLDETEALARKRGVDDAQRIAWLHERSNGWAAGLTLLLAGTRDAPGAGDDDADSLQHVFGYFAQRVFDGAPAAHRVALMRMAFVPLLTAELAERLTGLPEAHRLLEQFHKRQLFTDRRRIAANDGTTLPVFQFHALFRTFLQHRAQAAFGDAGCRDIGLKAARLLEDAGHWEPAVGLHAQFADHASLARLLVEHAERLLQQGRRQTVLDWIDRLPQAAREREPWLAYWEGRACGPAEGERALRSLHAAHARFEALGDDAGQLACGAAVVQTLWYARLGWSEITPWVDRLEPLIEPLSQGRLAFPTPAVELLSISALHAALSFCRLAHAGLREMGLRLLSLVDDGRIDWNQRLSTATHLITWLHNAAEYALATRLISRVDPLVEQVPASALNRAYWFIFRAMHDVRAGRYDEASQGFRRAESLAAEEGLAHAEFAALQFHAYLDVLAGRLDGAAQAIARMEVHRARGNPDAELNLAQVQAMLAQRRGDFRSALAHAERAVEAAERVGAAYFIAVFPAVIASVFTDAGQPERALAIVARSREIARGSYLETMESQLLVDEAHAAYARGDAAAGEARLREACTLAASAPERAAYVHRVVARKPELLMKALAAGIEVDFVRDLARRWRVLPPPDAPQSWPWPVKVRTLGGFEVLIDDRPIEFGRKTPRKTLALLKALIARGGSAADATLIDAFWPDEDGDAAAKSLAAAVHRLRGLLGGPDVVTQQGGQVALERTRVWVDAWAFERALAAGNADLDAALALYRGTFFAEEEGEAWPTTARERLRSKFIQAVAGHAQRLEAERRDEEAIAWYLRGLEADNVVEPFYQGLMRCYHRLDRLPEAVSAYRRLKQTLSVTLSLAPSDGTEQLYRSLRLA